LYGEKFALGMGFVAPSETRVHLALLATARSANGTWNKEFLFGGKIALLHAITISRHRVTKCSILGSFAVQARKRIRNTE